MTPEFLTFQRFKTPEQAKMLMALLDEAGILYQLEDNSPVFDVTFAGNKLDADFHLKLHPEDFAKADQLLLKTSEKLLENSEESEYLHEFSDEELIEIVLKPDEWSRFDYLSAQKILQQRGKEINPEVLELLKKQRLKALSEPEKSPTVWIGAGYVLAVLGIAGGGFNLISIFMGLAFLVIRKTSPEGKRVYVYNASTRLHGLIIMLLSLLGTALGLIFRGYSFFEYLF